MKYLKYFESIRNKYSEMGVDNYYSKFKSEYKNPHIINVKKCINWINSKIKIGYFLDLSCGNGEVSEYLNSIGYNNFKGCDPYFSDIYQNNFNKDCFNLTFENISLNSLPEKFDTIICSYALHLCDKSYYNNLLYNLSRNCKYFVVISPSKYPIVDQYFELIDNIVINRTHCKIYKSKI